MNQSVNPESSNHSDQTPKTIAEEYAHRVWDKKDLKAIDDLVDKDIIIHSSIGKFQGSNKLKEVVEVYQAAFPDLVVTNKDVIGENDLVVLHWQVQATHQGNFKGIAPTGRRISYRGVTIYRFKDDKIVEYWAYLEMEHLLNQISSKEV